MLIHGQKQQPMSAMQSKRGEINKTGGQKGNLGVRCSTQRFGCQHATSEWLVRFLTSLLGSYVPAKAHLLDGSSTCVPDISRGGLDGVLAIELTESTGNRKQSKEEVVWHRCKPYAQAVKLRTERRQHHRIEQNHQELRRDPGDT